MSRHTLLISTPVVSGFVDDFSELEELGIEVLLVDYEIETEERLAREQDPAAAIARGEPVPLTEEQLDAFGRADMLVSFDAPLDLARVAPRLRWIQTIGSGVGQYRASIGDADIVLTNAAGVAAGSIADWVVGRILSIHKRFDEHRDLQARHEWTPAFGTDVPSSTVLIVGLGAIGRATAHRLRVFGPRLVGVRASYRPGMTDDDVDELIGPDQLPDALGRCDTVVLAAASQDANTNMFDVEAFAAMQEGSIFINVSRGHLVDEAALIAALESGRLRAAATDVARNEPLPADDPLWDAPNLFISPHSSASVARYGNRIYDMFLANLPKFLAGEPLDRVVSL